MPRGRPCKLTPELQKRLCDAIAAGNYYEAACGYAGIDYTTFRRWMERGEKATRGKFCDFCQAVRKAEADARWSWSPSGGLTCRITLKRAAISSRAAFPSAGAKGTRSSHRSRPSLLSLARYKRKRNAT